MAVSSRQIRAEDDDVMVLFMTELRLDFSTRHARGPQFRVRSDQMRSRDLSFPARRYCKYVARVDYGPSWQRRCKMLPVQGVV